MRKKGWPTRCRPTDRPQPAEAEKWLRSEYHWYHFGIVQEVADLVYSDIVRILGGTHEGQPDGCPLARDAEHRQAFVERCANLNSLSSVRHLC